MLVLNEKFIRKGKPVGLPYVGSKKKISKKIIEILKQNFDIEVKVVYDVFGGGGAITCECLINEIPVVYNDHDLSVGKMFKKALNCDREYIKSLVVSREEFFSIRDKQDKTTTDELKLLVNSFGNNRKDYIYSKEISDSKYSLAKEILKSIDNDFNYKKNKVYLDFINGENISSLVKEDKFKRMQQIHNIQQLNRVSTTKQKYLKAMKNRDYNYFSNIKNQILYLDPPYENTDISVYKDHNQFNHNDFYNWVVDMSKSNIVLLSSYNVSDDRFKVVFEFNKSTSTLSANGKDRSNGNYEKLYMVR